MTPAAEEGHEPVTVTDKRRIDPVTGEIREGSGGQERSDRGSATAGPAPSGSASAAVPESDEAVDLKATLQRVKAEYDNYRKRSTRENQAAADRGKEIVITQLLGVLDDLDRARSHGDLESGPLRSVADKLAAVLDGLGLTVFGEEGDEFDPAKHEAVQHEGEGSRPTVGSVMRRGYLLGGKVIRHAMVGVVDTVDEPPARRESDVEDISEDADAAADQAAESD